MFTDIDALFIAILLHIVRTSKMVVDEGSLLGNAQGIYGHKFANGYEIVCAPVSVSQNRID